MEVLQVENIKPMSKVPRVASQNVKMALSGRTAVLQGAKVLLLGVRMALVPLTLAYQQLHALGRQEVTQGVKLQEAMQGTTLQETAAVSSGQL